MRFAIFTRNGLRRNGVTLGLKECTRGLRTLCVEFLCEVLLRKVRHVGEYLIAKDVIPRDSARRASRCRSTRGASLLTFPIEWVDRDEQTANGVILGIHHWRAIAVFEFVVPNYPNGDV